MRRVKVEVQLATAKELYDHGDFQGSVEAITPLIAKRKWPRIQALDRRAAAYIGLRDWPAALRDARKAIRLYRRSVDGYLRTVEILCLMDNQKAASKVCREGLSNVPRGSEDYKILDDLRNRVVAADASLRTMDPLAVLPLEIVEMVLRRLAFREVLLLMSVSKTWKHVIETIPRLWSHLDLSAARSQVRWSFIEACIRRASGTLTHVTLNQTRNMSYDKFHRPQGLTYEKGLKSLIANCTLLSLRFQSTKYRGSLTRKTINTIANVSTLRTLVLERHYPVAVWDILIILDQCLNLETAEFHAIKESQRRIEFPPCPQLKALVANCYTDRFYTGMHQIPLINPVFCQSAPNLRKLEFRNWERTVLYDLGLDTLSKLEILFMDGTPLNEFPSLPRSLTTLVLDLDKRYQLSHTTNIIEAQLRNLQAVFISGCSNSPYALQVFLSPSRGKLRVFGLTDRIDSYPAFDYVLRDGLLENVEVLFVGNYLHWEDMEIIATHMPALRELHTTSGLLTRDGAVALVEKKGTPLRKLVGDIGFQTAAEAYLQANEVTLAMEIDGPTPTPINGEVWAENSDTIVQDNLLAAFRRTVNDLGLDASL